MAKIHYLIDEISDPKLRSELRQAARELRSSRTSGLVFEEHIPDEVALHAGSPTDPLTGRETGGVQGEANVDRGGAPGGRVDRHPRLPAGR